jgi:hypothetical protein
MRIKSWLEKSIWNPSDLRSKKTIAFTIGAFVVLALLLLEPFGMGFAITDFFFVGTIIGYGVCAFVMVYVAEVWIKPIIPFFNARYLPRWRILIWYLMMTLCMSIINYLYYGFFANALSDLYQYPSISLFSFVYQTIAVGLLPSVGLVLYFSRDLRFQKKLYEQLSVERGYLQIADENKKNMIRVQCADLLLLEARSNYVQVIYRVDGEIKKELIRTTLSKLSEELINTPIKRCHQSYMINTTLIIQFSKTARKKLAYLPGLKDPVPVSDKYHDTIMLSLQTEVSP